MLTLNLKPVICFNLHDAPNKAIVCCNNDDEMHVLEFMGPALRYWIDTYGLDDLPHEFEGPGLWYLEGDIRAYKGWTDCGYEHDEEWVTTICRRLTPEELKRYQDDRITPFEAEARAESLLLFVEWMANEFLTESDGEVIAVSLWKDRDPPANWKEFDQFSFTIPEFLLSPTRVETLAGKLVESARKWEEMQQDAWASGEMIDYEASDMDDEEWINRGCPSVP